MTHGIDAATVDGLSLVRCAPDNAHGAVSAERSENSSLPSEAKCRPRVKQMLEHLGLRCPGRKRNCRKHLGCTARTTMFEVCTSSAKGVAVGFVKQRGSRKQPSLRTQEFVAIKK